MRDEPNSSLIRFLSFVIGLDKNVCTWCARFYVRSKKKHNTKNEIRPRIVARARRDRWPRSMAAR
jgi:hypothetical protein